MRMIIGERPARRSDPSFRFVVPHLRGSTNDAGAVGGHDTRPQEMRTRSHELRSEPDVGYQIMAPFP